MSEERIEVPVDVYLVLDPDGEITTVQTPETVRAMFVEVNRIWQPANIQFVIKKIETLEINSQALVNIVGIPLPGRPFYDRIDLYYVNNFQGWMQRTRNEINRFTNGFTVIPLRQVCVRDFPELPVTNERCLAHEFGHVLISQEHPVDPNRLMSGGHDGINFLENEIEISRANAESFIN